MWLPLRRATTLWTRLYVWILTEMAGAHRQTAMRQRSICPQSVSSGDESMNIICLLSSEHWKIALEKFKGSISSEELWITAFTVMAFQGSDYFCFHRIFICTLMVIVPRFLFKQLFDYNNHTVPQNSARSPGCLSGVLTSSNQLTCIFLSTPDIPSINLKINASGNLAWNRMTPNIQPACH